MPAKKRSSVAVADSHATAMAPLRTVSPSRTCKRRVAGCPSAAAPCRAASMPPAWGEGVPSSQ